MSKLMRSLVCGLLALGLILSFLMPVLAAPETETQPEEPRRELHISTLGQFLDFAKRCRMDSYSRDLTVYLDEDIDLTGREFSAIPMFQGTFEGNNHTISGLELTDAGSYLGLFRYLTETAHVKDLRVEGTVAPTGTQLYIGGIAGSNAGTIEDCEFSGEISGQDFVGGIAGTNRLTGHIENSRMSGSITAKHFIGGMAGENMGVIRGCLNRADINITPIENTVNVSSITLDTLTGTEDPNTVTDVGGIAGTCTGVIRDCFNRGDVGYLHMGYNIGGIAGSLSGYLTGCKNYGDIYGRKEAGGIVGQFEPVTRIEYAEDTLQILEQQLSAASGTLNRAAYNAQSSMGGISESLGEMRDYAGNAKDAINQLIPSGPDDFPDPDEFVAAKNTLNQSLHAMQSAMEDAHHAASQSAGQLARDMKTLSSQMSTMGKTIDDASRHMGATLTDVSDQDTPEDLTGKLSQCQNFGQVSGDLNAGGIAGSIAFENDFDPEDDLEIVGDTSLNVEGDLRAVILDCRNMGKITGKKLNVGGIVGRMTMGLVKDSINTGYLDCEKAQYVGGIAGVSEGYLRSCHVKCGIRGASNVGGIAGSGTVATDCLSMVSIEEATEKLGAVLGEAQAPRDDSIEVPVSGNFYLSLTEDPGAVDGISYEGLAEPLTPRKFLSQEDLPQAFEKTTLTFRFEDGEEATLVLPVGSPLPADQVPALPQREGYTGTWEGLEDLDQTRIYFDDTFVPEYVPIRVTIRSYQARENDRPVLLAEGRFPDTPRIEMEELELPDLEGRKLREAWTLPVFSETQDTVLHYSLPQDLDPQYVTVLLRDGEGSWREVPHEVNASYLIFSSQPGDTGLCLETHTNYKPFLRVAFWTLAAVALLTLLGIRRKKKKAQKKKKA